MCHWISQRVQASSSSVESLWLEHRHSHFAKQISFGDLLDPSSKLKTQPKTDLYTASFVHWIQWDLLSFLLYFQPQNIFASIILIELKQIHLMPCKISEQHCMELALVYLHPQYTQSTDEINHICLEEGKNSRTIYTHSKMKCLNQPDFYTTNQKQRVPRLTWFPQ